VKLAFLLPAGFVALAALVLPLLVHLARRSESRPTVFAALRWLRARPRPRHRIRFDEKALLAVRLLLLVLCALLLARPVLSGVDDDRPVVAVAPTLGASAVARSGAPADARRVWLAEGFPGVRDGPVPAAPHAPLTSLLRELDATLPQGVALTVLVPPVLDGVDAERPRLGRPVAWRVVRAAVADVPGASAEAPMRLAIRYDDEADTAVRILRAVDAAWRAGRDRVEPDVARVDSTLPPVTRPLAWLAPGPVPPAVRDWVARGGTLLLDARAAWPTSTGTAVLWRDAGGAALVEGKAHGRGRVLRFTRSLDARRMPVVLDPTFPTELRRVLAPEPHAPARVSAAAHAPRTGGPVFVPAPRDLQPWLLLAIALLFLVERVMATGRRGRDAP
jgi:hypothetical protein